MSRGARVCDGGGDAPTLRDWLAAGPYTLALSSSFFGFYSHAGSLAALEEVGLTPAAITGSSAGALAGAAWAAGLDARDGMRDFMLRTRREDAMRPFWRRPCAGLMKLNVGPLESALPVLELERTRVPCRVSVFDVLSLRTRVVTSGAIAPAVAASCAVPLLFAPTVLDGRPCFDGGLGDCDAFAGCVPGERVLSIQHENKAHVAIDADASRPAGEPAQRPASVRPLTLVDRLMRTLLSQHEPPKDTVVLTLSGLPFVAPDRMCLGERAMDEATSATRAALDMRIARPGVGGVPATAGHIHVACAPAPSAPR